MSLVLIVFTAVAVSLFLLRRREGHDGFVFKQGSQQWTRRHCTVEDSWQFGLYARLLRTLGLGDPDVMLYGPTIAVEAGAVPFMDQDIVQRDWAAMDHCDVEVTKYDAPTADPVARMGTGIPATERRKIAGDVNMTIFRYHASSWTDLVVDDQGRVFWRVRKDPTDTSVRGAPVPAPLSGASCRP